MRLSVELKNKIDCMPYDSMVRQWQTAPINSYILSGESGDYFTEVMYKKKKLIEKAG